MLHDESLTPRKFWVLAPHLDIAGPRDKARYDLPKFTVNRQMIEAAVRNVELAGSMIRYLAGLARALSDAGLLYPRRAPYAGRPATVTVTDTRSFPPESNLARSVPTTATTTTTKPATITLQLDARHVFLAGWRPHEQLPQALNAADAHVLPSVAEAFGLALVEAMACGLPVIACDAHGPAEIVRDGESGWLIPPR